MSKPTENDLFNEILAALDCEKYDPAIHLLPATAAERWHISEKHALSKLRAMADERGLVEVVVHIQPGRRRIAFKQKAPLP